MTAQKAAPLWTLVATILGSSLAFVDGTVVTVALPALQRDFDAAAADVQWVVEAYALLFSALLLVGGSLGDRFGRRRVYALGIVTFTGASMLCGLAPSVTLLIAARALQGIGAALLVPGSLALIAASFTTGHERGKAIGTWSAFSAIATALGPVLGGWLVDTAGWRYAFFLNLPVALVTLAILFWRVEESRDRSAARHFDWLGASLAAAGLGGIVYGLIEAARLGWGHRAIVGAIGLGFAGLAAFFIVESRSKAPMLPLGLFKSQRFAGANLLTAGLYGALTATMFLLPLNLIQVQRYSATAAGASLLPLILIIFLLSRWTGGLAERVGPRLPLVIGPAVAAAGMALMALPGVGGSYWATFFPPMVVLGLGMAITVPALTTTVMDAVDVAHAGTASGINNAVTRAAGLLTIALMGVPMLAVFSAQLVRRLPAHGVPAPVAAEVLQQRIMLAEIQPPPSATPAQALAVRQAVAESFVAGFRVILLASAAMALLGAVLAAFMVGGESVDPVPG